MEKGRIKVQKYSEMSRLEKLNRYGLSYIWHPGNFRIWLDILGGWDSIVDLNVQKCSKYPKWVSKWIPAGFGFSLGLDKGFGVGIDGFLRRCWIDLGVLSLWINFDDKKGAELPYWECGWYPGILSR